MIVTGAFFTVWLIASLTKGTKIFTIFKHQLNCLISIKFAFFIAYFWAKTDMVSIYFWMQSFVTSFTMYQFIKNSIFINIKWIILLFLQFFLFLKFKFFWLMKNTHFFLWLHYQNFVSVFYKLGFLIWLGVLLFYNLDLLLQVLLFYKLGLLGFLLVGKNIIFSFTIKSTFNNILY